MSDYYSILGISKGTSDDEIKRAYKKLALKTHPDKNGGDDTEFKKINLAYETLSDPLKKNEYDHQHINNMNNMNNMNDQFFNFHQNHSNIKLNDHHYTCRISLKDVFFGTTKKLKVHRNYMCKSCVKDCNVCNGSGKISRHIQMGPFTQIAHITCNACSGEGKKKNDENIYCTKCSSKGILNEERIFEIILNPGVETGKTIVFEEWGEQATRNNQISGSFIITIKVEDHHIFKRNKLQLRYIVDLTLKESIIGKMLTIPHFLGNFDIDTNGFGIINPEKEYIIYDKGLKNENDKLGNLHLIFKIKYPEKTLTNEEIEIFKGLDF